MTAGRWRRSSTTRSNPRRRTFSRPIWLILLTNLASVRNNSGAMTKMVELVMRKRAGHAGEIGLFVDSPVWEGELANIKEGAEVKVVATTPRSLRQLKFAWALATK